MYDRWIFILLFVPTLALVVRALISRDPPWQRTIGGVFAAMIIVIVAIYQTKMNGPPMIFAFGVFGAGVVYLLFWAVMSKDPAIHRFGSAAAAIVGAMPILILFKFYVE